MHKPTRTQHDDQQDYYSEITGLDCSESKDMARQEDKQSTDVNYILDRFGVTTNRQPVYTETDYDLDLAQSLDAVEQAQQFHASLPDEFRRKYTWRTMLDAIASGQFAAELTTYKNKTTVTPTPTASTQP